MTFRRREEQFTNLLHRSKAWIRQRKKLLLACQDDLYIRIIWRWFSLHFALFSENLSPETCLSLRRCERERESAFQLQQLLRLGKNCTTGHSWKSRKRKTNFFSQFLSMTGHIANKLWEMKVGFGFPREVWISYKLLFPIRFWYLNVIYGSAEFLFIFIPSAPCIFGPGGSSMPLNLSRLGLTHCQSWKSTAAFSGITSPLNWPRRNPWSHCRKQSAETYPWREIQARENGCVAQVVKRFSESLESFFFSLPLFLSVTHTHVGEIYLYREQSFCLFRDNLDELCFNSASVTATGTPFGTPYLQRQIDTGAEIGEFTSLEGGGSKKSPI